MAIKVPMIVDQGTTFEAIIFLNDAAGDPYNVSGMSARSYIKKHFTSLTKTEFSVTLATGQIRLALTSAQTANMASGRYVYDVEIVDSANNVLRLVEGICTVTPEVTRG